MLPQRGQYSAAPLVSPRSLLPWQATHSRVSGKTSSRSGSIGWRQFGARGAERIELERAVTALHDLARQARDRAGFALGINANTVTRVYSDLQQEGLLRLERGLGTFVQPQQREPTLVDAFLQILEVSMIGRRGMRDQ